MRRRAPRSRSAPYWTRSPLASSISHLTAIADAVHARRHLLHTVRSATALAELCIGEVVRINDTVSPQYLHGAYATVVEIDDRTATVQLQRPVGRFRSGQIRCPALALDRVPRAV